ncbi:MAG: rRNA pseudouridine synthase, partial [Solirubrobacteraceae bacterium]|nr:rRNA pseudouridine synthase [Solirubrobacteraceae bacterium]
MRLAKYLAQAGVASRRAAESLIEQGRVRVDGALITTPVFFVEPGMDVRVDGEKVDSPEERASVVYMLNKPLGVVSTSWDPQGRPTVTDYAPPEAGRVYPVGRLDIDSSGLLLVTNDGDLAHRLTHPSFEVPKTYLVRIAHPPIKRGELDELRRGVELDDGLTAPTDVTAIAPAKFEITLREGRNRQVRRMCDAIGHPVKELQRIRFGDLELGHLLEGGVRRLKPQEVEALRALAGEAKTPRPGTVRRGGRGWPGERAGRGGAPSANKPGDG